MNSTKSVEMYSKQCTPTNSFLKSNHGHSNLKNGITLTVLPSNKCYCK